MSDPAAPSPERRLPALFEIPTAARCDTCRSCRAVGYWITTAKGKQMFVEVDHSDRRQAVPAPGQPGKGQSHFIRCPQAGMWRGRKSPA
jgi:hypothetical protein